MIDYTKPIEIVDTKGESFPVVEVRKLRGWSNHLVIWKRYEGGEIEYHGEFDSLGKPSGYNSLYFVRNVREDAVVEPQWSPGEFRNVKPRRPATDRLFNKFHSTRLSHDFFVDPDHMAAVFKELGYYSK